MSHTPGPWWKDEESASVRANCSWNPRGTVVANAYDPEDSAHTTATSLANARLIAAAPELLEAVKLMREMEKAGLIDASRSGLLDRLRKAVDAALTKVEPEN
jgi:hypothetical protein